MTRLESLAVKMSHLPVESQSDARLNIEDRRAVSVVCFAFDCRPEDVYVAVAMVGDKLQDVRAYLRRALDQGEIAGPAMTMTLKPLPPLWPIAS